MNEPNLLLLADLLEGKLDIQLWGFDMKQFVDNTPQGLAKRSRYLIEHGLPEDWEGQMRGRVPLCYL